MTIANGGACNRSGGDQISVRIGVGTNESARLEASDGGDLVYPNPRVGGRVNIVKCNVAISKWWGGERKNL